MSSNLKVNTILPSTGDTVSIAGIASITSSVSIASSCTATTFFGSGANLTGITGTTINTNADNRIITGSGTANTLNGEPTFTYTNTGSAAQLNFKRTTATDAETIFYYDSNNLEIETREATGMKLKCNKNDRITIDGSTGHVIIDEQLGIGGVDPGGSTLLVNGNVNLSAGGNTSWQKVTLNGSNNSAGDTLSMNNWGDAEGDYWMIGVNQTMNQSGNYAKTNSGKRTSFVTLDGRMGRVYLGGASTSGNPTSHFYTNWDGSVYMNAGFGSVTPFYGVRAWVQGNSGTTNASGGLSSMSRISTGRFRLNFATTMPDDNYATGCLANNNYDDTSWHGNTETTRVDVHFYTGSSYVDPSEWSAWVIR